MDLYCAFFFLEEWSLKVCKNMGDKIRHAAYIYIYYIYDLIASFYVMNNQATVAKQVSAQTCIHYISTQRKVQKTLDYMN